MTFHVALNRAGLPCIVDAFGTHDARDTVEQAAAECARRNRASQRAAEIRAARELAQSRLGALSQRHGVRLALLPTIEPQRAVALALPEIA